MLLAIVDRPYRGVVEAQFVHCLYFARELHRQVGRVDVALRGIAVTLAVRDDRYRPELDFCGQRLDTLPDYRAGVNDLLGDGATVLVDDTDLRALGLSDEHLLPGVRCLDTTLLARDWPAYEGVWFL